jgi:uncharacterized protein (TIGR02145 family)/uncharacterized repeat protein (TIGR02543 family)
MSENRTVIANFREIGDTSTPILPTLFTLTINAGDGGTTSPSGASQRDSGSVVEIFATADSGYTFNNWTVSSGTATFGNANNANTTVTLSSNATIVANFTQNPVTSYTVTYNINGGTGATPPPTDVTAGDSVVLASGSEFTRSGFTFEGWNINSDGTGTNYNVGASFTPMGDVILFARWNCNYTGGRVKIDNLIWMAENLNCETSNSWCYDNDPTNCAKYGRLYTWDAAMSACPAGWRLPTYADWDDLVSVAGGSSVAGKNLKSVTGWIHPGWGDLLSNTDIYGFSALPGGHRDTDGNFLNVGWGGHWWSAMEYDVSIAWSSRDMYSFTDYVLETYDPKGVGLSVRCVVRG